MKIRIFYLLQDCYEYKFMFEYNIKMYNSHLIFVLCARSHLFEAQPTLEHTHTRIHTEKHANTLIDPDEPAYEQ